MNNARHLLRKFALLLGFAVLGTGANAGNIRGAWDPQFNSTFSGVGFSGAIQFWVPDQCLGNGTPGGDAFFYNTDPCSSANGGMFFLSATVDLYNYPNNSSIISSMTFVPPAPSPNPIIGVLVHYDGAGGAMVTGLDTGIFGPQPSGTGGSPTGFPDFLYLQFVSGAFESTVAGAYLVGGVCPDGINTCTPSTALADQSNPGKVTYTPEPGTMALLLAGLGATLLVARRRMMAA